MQYQDSGIYFNGMQLNDHWFRLNDTGAPDVVKSVVNSHENRCSHCWQHLWNSSWRGV